MNLSSKNAGNRRGNSEHFVIERNNKDTLIEAMMVIILGLLVSAIVNAPLAMLKIVF